MDSIKGQCEYVIANLKTAERISPQTIAEKETAISAAPLVVMDANLRADTIESLVQLCYRNNVPIFLEPTDVVALPRLVTSIRKLQRQNCAKSILCLSPNLFELQKMRDLFGGLESVPGNQGAAEMLTIENVEKLACDFMANCMPELRCLLVTLDKRGVVVALRSGVDGDINEIHLMDMASEGGEKIWTNYFAASKLVDKPVSASGAGDSFAAGFISGLIKRQKLEDCIDRGFRAALLALDARDTIPASLRLLDD